VYIYIFVCLFLFFFKVALNPAEALSLPVGVLGTLELLVPLNG
jgi:hypothetical protein